MAVEHKHYRHSAATSTSRSVTHRAFEYATPKVKAVESTCCAWHCCRTRTHVTYTESWLLSKTRWRTFRIKMQRNGSKPSAYKKLFLISPPGATEGSFVREAVVMLGGELQFYLKRMNPYGPCSSSSIDCEANRPVHSPPTHSVTRKKHNGLTLPPFICTVWRPHRLFYGSFFLFLKKINAKSEMQYLNR